MQTLIKPCVVTNCGWGAASIPAQAEALCACVREEEEKEKGRDEL
jgi:hypothetical protein